MTQALEALSNFPTGLTSTELATHTGLSWQASNRILEGLLAESVVIKDEATKKYQLSLHICDWASSIIQGRTAISIARKECVMLALEIGRRIDFLVLEDLHAVSVERCDPSDGVPLSRFVSARRLWYESATGRVIIAYSPPNIREAILERTYSTPGLNPPDIDQLNADLDAIPEYGFAVTPANPSVTSGIVVPIRDHTGFAVAAISTSFPERNIESEEGKRIVSRMKFYAYKISQYLGFEDLAGLPIG